MGGKYLEAWLSIEYANVVKPNVSSGIINYFSSYNVVPEVAASYHPEIKGMAERLKRLLKDRLHHVKKDQGFNLQKLE